MNYCVLTEVKALIELPLVGGAQLKLCLFGFEFFAENVRRHQQTLRTFAPSLI